MADPRRRWLVVGLVLAAALIIAGLWSTRPTTRPARAASVPDPAPLPHVSMPRATEEALERELPEAIQRYLERTIYPPTSGTLEVGAVDLLEPNRRYERMGPVPGARGVDQSFLWTTDRFRYTSDQVVHARFEALEGELPARIRELHAKALPEGRAGATGDTITLSFRGDGDAELADLDLAQELADHHGPVSLTVRYALGDEPAVEETLRIFVTPVGRIPARFTGSFRDEARDGGLLVEAGIEVEQPGFYRFDANLYDASGEPIAWAVYKGERNRHDGTVPLRFFGKLLRDAGRAGPYRVAQLRGYLFREGEFPDRLELRDYPGIFETAAWPLSAFSDEEWDGEHRRRMVELLMEDERRGLSLDLPSVAVEAGSDPGALGPPR